MHQFNVINLPGTSCARLLPLVLAMWLGGCSLMPDYQRPLAPVAARFSGDATSSVSSLPVADIGWREVFTDPALQRVIELTLANNRDLRVAVLNIEKARAQYGVQRAAPFHLPVQARARFFGQHHEAVLVALAFAHG